MKSLLIADDHEIITQGLASYLKGINGFSVAATTINGSETLDYLADNKVDLVVLDLQMPEMNGLECMEVIARDYPDQKVLILTIYQEDYVIQKLYRLKVRGIIHKNQPLSEIVEAIRTICDGGTYFNHIELKDPLQMDMISLTSREKQVIALVAKGFSNNEIGQKLHISEYTVSTHRKNVMKKLNFTNLAQLVSFVENSGIFSD